MKNKTKGFHVYEIVNNNKKEKKKTVSSWLKQFIRTRILETYNLCSIL